ncbi:MAG TPA: chitobiase/beta-hexosaminidase C-terminal domain-containing protein, partial [Opitutaceae bacterium]|nr:chitobiase/beta-hexosaminidase C-terminal domain-containing protein [Opitutaceae bacterium]
NNAKVLQFAYPGAQLGTGSSSTLLTEAQNTFTQLNCWTESHACLAYPIAARIDYPASTILSNLDSEINNSAYPNLAFHTGGGGIEDVNIVPGTVDEMLLQSCQGTLRLFNDWPSNTTATFGDLLADGAFLISAQVSGSGNTVQYVRCISQKGRTAVFSNPWPGQSVEVYRNGVDTGTVSGTTFSITTSTGDTILMATAGTSYATILSRMGLGNQVAAPTFSPGGGNYSSAQNVSITSTTGGASIRYTTDGSTPSETAGTLYSGPVNIGSTATLNAIAYESGMTDSSITSATYTIGSGGTMTEQCSTLAESNTSGLTYSPITGGPNGEVACKLYSTAVGQYLQFTVTGIVQGTSYDVTIGYRSDPSRGQCQLTVNGTAQPQLATLDEYQATSNWNQTQDLGTFTAGAPGTTRTFTFTVSGKNAAATGYTMAPEWIALTPL